MSEKEGGKGTVHNELRLWPYGPVVCCGVLVKNLPEGDVLDANPENVTCGRVEPVDLEVGDHIRVCGRVFVLSEVYIHRVDWPSVYFDSLDELMTKREEKDG